MSGHSMLRLSRRTLLQLSISAALWPWASRGESAAPSMQEEILAADRRDQRFDAGWRFLRGDGDGLASSNFDDSDWRSLDLPHDWSIEDLPRSLPALNAEIREVDTAPLWQPVKNTPRLIGPFDAELNDNQNTARSAGGALTAFTVGGIGWYRKRFRLPPLTPDARVEIEFDGVYMNAQVWLNGVLLGERPNGYSPFAYDLTPYLDKSGENTVAVRVANLGRNSRWYSGSGIYRHVRINVTRALRFERWGVVVTTPSVTTAVATVKIEARIESSVPGVTVTTRIKNAAGRLVAEARDPADKHVTTTLELRKPQLWSPDSPALYQVECLLHSGEQLVDTITAPLGLRRVEIDAEQGLRINGKPYKLRGGCVHHDNGLLGAVAIDRAEIRKVELLKARGFNAIRTSHNPPSSAFLHACDRLGMLVMEEAFDVWNVNKNPDDYGLYFRGWWQRDLAAMVRRDGNHPCVIMWSFGNEIPERARPDGVATAKMLADELRRLDPTRPITQAINGSNGEDVIGPDGRADQAATQYLDVAGYNYKLSAYEKDHERFADRVMVGAESFPGDVDKIWRLADRSPYLIGDFVWTAVDYLGEAAIGRTTLSKSPLGADVYPWFGAFCGDLDLIGQQKPQSLLRDVVWGLSPLEVAVQRPLTDGQNERPFLWGWRDELQSWSWPGAEGRSLNINLYTRADRVRVELNGKVVADLSLTPENHSTAKIAVPYEAGRLVATAFLAGRSIGRRVLETAGPAAAVRLKVDRPRITASRDDLAHVTVEIVDAAGRLVPDAVHVLRTSVSGGAELVAFGNANPRGVASFRQPVAKSWHGRALAVLRPTGAEGVTTITVESDGLSSARASIALMRPDAS
jgi:beta-galactosidase